MMQTVYEMTIDMIAKHYGLDHQQMKTIEELGEASAAISRYVLDPSDRNLRQLAEELADAQIMIDQLLALSPMLKCYFVQKRSYKIERQLMRMADDAKTDF